MTSTLNKAIIFAAGAAFGSAVTWKFFKTKYERISKEEIESVKRVFSRRKNNDVKQEEETVEETHEDSTTFSVNNQNEKPDIIKYASMVNALGYSGEPEETKNEEEEDEDLDGYKPYVISPEEFEEYDDYESETLTYYADGVLTNCYDEIIEDVDDIVGLDSFEHFGEFEKDTVYVRNEDLKIDYEIQRDLRNYYDVYPQNMED